MVIEIAAFTPALVLLLAIAVSFLGMAMVGATSLAAVPRQLRHALANHRIGVTAAVTLAVYASQGRLAAAIAPAVVGGLVGGRLGAALQPRIPAPLVRWGLSIVLAALVLIAWPFGFLVG